MTDRNVEELLKNSLPSASKQEVQSVGDRVLESLQSDPDRMPTRAVIAFDRPRRTSWRWVPTAAIAAAIVIAALLPTRIVQSTPAVLEDASGSRKIQYGETVRPSGEMSAMLSMAAGPRVEMRSKSELRIERTEDGGTRIRLDRGRVIVDAAGLHNGNLSVQTKDIMASVSGAVTLVRTEEEGSRVVAIGGEIRVQQGAAEKKLRSGEQVTSNPRMESISMKEEIAWSREAMLHLTMMGQSANAASQVPKEETLAFEVTTIRPAVPPLPPGPNARGGGAANNRQLCNFETVQLDPRRFSIRNSSLYELVGWAYGPCFQMVGIFPTVNPRLSSDGPDWIKLARWDIEALIPAGTVDPLPSTGLGGPVLELIENRSPKVQQMIRTLLEQRFKVVVRREIKEMAVHVLTVAPGGTKFQGNGFNYGFASVGPGMIPAGADEATRAAIKPVTAAEGLSTYMSNIFPCFDQPESYCTRAVFLNQFMAIAAPNLAFFTDRPVLDRTGIREKVSFAIDWPTDPPVRGQPRQNPPIKDVSKALERVGLQLKADPKGLVEFFVIERAEKPSEN